MVNKLWILTMFGSILGFIILLSAIIGNWSAIQEAAIASFGIGLAVIPYCLARAASEINRN